MFKKLIPVFSADVAHCTGSTKGTMFSMYGSDVKKRQVLLDIMLKPTMNQHFLGLLF